MFHDMDDCSKPFSIFAWRLIQVLHQQDLPGTQQIGGFCKDQRVNFWKIKIHDEIFLNNTSDAKKQTVYKLEWTE